MSGRAGIDSTKPEDPSLDFACASEPPAASGSAALAHHLDARSSCAVWRAREVVRRCDADRPLLTVWGVKWIDVSQVGVLLPRLSPPPARAIDDARLPRSCGR